MTLQLSITVRLVSDSARALLSEILAATSMCHSMGYLGMHKAWEDKAANHFLTSFSSHVPSPCVAFNKLCLKTAKEFGQLEYHERCFQSVKFLWLKDSTVQKVVTEKKTVGPQIQVCCLHVRQPCEESRRVDFAAVLLWFTFSRWLLGNWPSHVVEDAVSSRAESIFLAPNATAPARSERVHTEFLMFWKLGLINILYQLYRRTNA